MSQQYIKKYNIRAKKSLGQNFLVDEETLSEIASSIDIEGKNIIEVGAGYGVLTEKILEKKPTSLHLIELDRDMIDILEDRFSCSSAPNHFLKDEENFKIFHQDVLDFTPEFENYSIIANIPYYITSPILRHFLYTLTHTPEKMLILMQKDVGDKILGKGKNKSSVLSLMLEKKCNIQEKIFVPKESFLPVPKVESSVLYFERHNNFLEVDDTYFLECIKKGFAEPRKKLLKNLLKGGYEKNLIENFLKKNNFSENVRGEDLNCLQWYQLCQELRK